MIIDMGQVLVDLNLTQGILPGTLHFPPYQKSVKHKLLQLSHKERVGS